MKDLCSIHISKECHDVLQNLSKKYLLDMRKLANFCIMETAKEIQEDHTRLFNIFTQEKLNLAPPTVTEIINTLFERAALEGMDYVWSLEIYKAVKPKHAAIPSEIDKLGFIRYIPEGQRELAWKKN